VTQEILDRQFVEVIVAPEIDEAAHAVLERKRNVRVLATGDRGRFVRVSDSDSKLLRELARLGIRPGDELEVVAGGVRTGSATHRLRRALARSMRVELTR